MRNFLIVLMAVLAVIFGSGAGYNSYFTPVSSEGQFSGVYGDNWLVDGATMEFSGLLPVGNKLRFQVGGWHPENVPPAHLKVDVCDQSAAEFIAVPGSIHTIPLRGECEPRTVTYKVVHPFLAGPNDTRELGAQLHSVQIRSKIRVPLLAARTLLMRTLALLVLVSLVVVHFPKGMRLLPAGTVAFLGGVALAATEERLLPGLYGFWSFLVAFLFGAWVLEGLRNRTPPFAPVQDSSVRGVQFFSIIVLAGVLVLAFSLRYVGLDFGLPENYHPDEVPKFNAIMRMVQYGDLNPRYFLHPTLLLYSAYFFNTLFHWLGVPGDWSDTLILSGRFVSLTAGVLSVYLVYAIGTRLFDRFAGLTAASFLAVAPLHVTCSRYLKEDSLLVFVTLLTVLTVLKAVQEDRPRLLLLAALFGGASASVKYSGLLSIFILLGAPWLRSRSFVPDRRYLRWTAGAAILFPFGFVLCSPYTVLDSTKFLHDFRMERNHMSRGHTTAIDPWSQYWMYHFTRSILPGTSYLLAFLGVMGLGIIAWRRRLSDLYVVCLFLLFYLPAEYVKAKPAPQPERYILPCLPILALAAGEFVRQLSALRARVFVPALLTCALLIPFLHSSRLASEVQNDTREQMARWMSENIAPGSTVFIDWKPYSPRLERTAFVPEYLPRENILGSLQIEELRSSGVDYLLLSSLFYDRYFSQPNALPVQREQIRELFRTLPVVKEIAPKFGTYGFHNPKLTLFRLKRDEGGEKILSARVSNVSELPKESPDRLDS